MTKARVEGGRVLSFDDGMKKLPLSEPLTPNYPINCNAVKILPQHSFFELVNPPKKDPKKDEGCYAGAVMLLEAISPRFHCCWLP